MSNVWATIFYLLFVRLFPWMPIFGLRRAGDDRLFLRSEQAARGRLLWMADRLGEGLLIDLATRAAAWERRTADFHLGSSYSVYFHVIRRAIERIRSDQRLADLLLTGDVQEVRRHEGYCLRLRRIEDQDVLVRIIREAGYWSLQKAAILCLDQDHTFELAMGWGMSGLLVPELAVRTINSQDRLEEIATRSPNFAAAETAVRRLERAEVIHGIALSDEDDRPVEEAVRRTRDRGVLERVVQQSPFRNARLMAAHRLDQVIPDLIDAVRLLRKLEEGSRGGLDDRLSLVGAAILVDRRGIENWQLRDNVLYCWGNRLPTEISCEKIALAGGSFWSNLRYQDMGRFLKWLGDRGDIV